jgi:hypothetical protein
MSAMKGTPITDKHVWIYSNKPGGVVSAHIARRLESDRAELIEVVEGFMREFGDKAMNANVRQARTLLARIKEEPMKVFTRTPNDP